MQILTDEHVTKFISPTEAVAVMEQVFLARANGRYAGKPRWTVPFEQGGLVFTAGGTGNAVGFRAYVRGNHLTHDDQVTLVWEQSTGKLKGMVMGVLLGAVRTGAIGGVAVKHLAPPNAEILGLIGTGKQAFTQLQAIASVRAIKEVRVFSRTPAHREAFCADASELMPHLKFYPTENAESAVRGADIVVAATTSREPVIRAEWLKHGAHVSTLGSKSAASREIDEALVNEAGIVVTDSPEQVNAADFKTLLDGTTQNLVDLAEVVSGKISRPVGKFSLFLSVGLAGTEVALAARLLDKIDHIGDEQ